jgi:hypothetical protein
VELDEVMQVYRLNSRQARDGFARTARMVEVNLLTRLFPKRRAAALIID